MFIGPVRMVIYAVVTGFGLLTVGCMIHESYGYSTPVPVVNTAKVFIEEHENRRHLTLGEHEIRSVATFELDMATGTLAEVSSEAKDLTPEHVYDALGMDYFVSYVRDPAAPESQSYNCIIVRWSGRERCFGPFPGAVDKALAVTRERGSSFIYFALTRPQLGSTTARSLEVGRLEVTSGKTDLIIVGAFAGDGAPIELKVSPRTTEMAYVAVSWSEQGRNQRGTWMLDFGRRVAAKIAAGGFVCLDAQGTLVEWGEPYYWLPESALVRKIIRNGAESSLKFPEIDGEAPRAVPVFGTGRLLLLYSRAHHLAMADLEGRVMEFHSGSVKPAQ